MRKSSTIPSERNSFFLRSIITLGSLVLCGTSPTLAQSLVDSSQLRATSVSVLIKGKRSAHTVFCLGTTAGVAARRPTGLRFTPYSIVLRDLKKKDPKSKKLPLFRAISSAGRAACTIGIAPTPTPGAVAPGPIPTATAQPTTPPAPLPTNTPPSGNFDARGNVTEKGKAVFGIPSNLSANVSAGKIVGQSLCTGCHGERVGLSYQTIDSAIRRSPMLYDESAISRQQLADLVAYLNRFRP